MKYYVYLAFVSLALFFATIPVNAQTRLTIASDDWAPYEMVQDNVVNAGFSLEVIQAVLREMNVGINGKIRAYPFARLDHHILNGDVDAAFSLSRNEARQEKCHFPSESLVNSKWVLFIRKENEGALKFSSLEDLKGKGLVSLEGMHIHQIFGNF
ncbi:transporter substrate-binding domain-containing protein [Shewanella sp. ULN5]|uniref:substrate-binding periplasmic protein n=1 Tax=Shewanella sp. ULN5 TaxID=2994678 RepID=UPI00273EB41D|nr:transporter substrate-binding domain-containing protein [Shewanella sp. ULN5]MDP5148288.1 transporter substrate-binding domain-containing protein [Shewanella sp. ULN5]